MSVKLIAAVGVTLTVLGFGAWALAHLIMSGIDKIDEDGGWDQ